MPEKTPQKISAWQYASEGTQLAVTLLLGLFVGYKLDQHWGRSPWFLLAGAALGLIAGLYNFLRRFLSKS
jgi:F0F1-type ATP synthase assembly protein I